MKPLTANDDENTVRSLLQHHFGGRFAQNTIHSEELLNRLGDSPTRGRPRVPEIALLHADVAATIKSEDITLETALREAMANRPNARPRRRRTSLGQSRDPDQYFQTLQRDHHRARKRLHQRLDPLKSYGSEDFYECILCGLLEYAAAIFVTSTQKARARYCEQLNAIIAHRDTD